MTSSFVHINCCFITSEIGSRRRNCENFMLQMSLILDLCLLHTRRMIGLMELCAGPGCSKLTTSLVNVLLKFQTLISQICQYFLSKKCEKLLQCKSFSHFFNKKYHLTS